MLPGLYISSKTKLTYVPTRGQNSLEHNRRCWVRRFHGRYLYRRRALHFCTTSLPCQLRRQRGNRWARTLDHPRKNVLAQLLTEIIADVLETLYLSMTPRRLLALLSSFMHGYLSTISTITIIGAILGFVFMAVVEGIKKSWKPSKTWKDGHRFIPEPRVVREMLKLI